MGKIEKSPGSVSAIGGNDGPTSIFLAGKGKETIKQRIHKGLFAVRKKWCSLWIKPDAHTMDEVILYIKEKYAFEEIAKETREYLAQYDSTRASFIMQYKPQLLGEYADLPKLKSHDEESLKAFMEELKMREQKAREVTDDEFSIDFHVLEKIENKNRMHFYLESRFQYIGGGFSGPGKRRVVDYTGYEKLGFDTRMYKKT